MMNSSVAERRPNVVFRGLALGFLLSLACFASACADDGEAARPDIPVCDSKPVTVTGDVLDPNEVYLMGTVAEGYCPGNALAHWSSPNTALAGFPGCSSEGQVRPTDGRLVYISDFDYTLREFSCDDCPSSGSYPSMPSANDTVLPIIPKCDPRADPLNVPLSGLRVSPSGQVLYRCSGETWYDLNGGVIYTHADESLLHLGFSDLALTERRVLNLGTGASTSIKHLPSRPILAVRARAPDKFMVLLEAAQLDNDGRGQELWEVDAKGVATRLGVFPLVPSGAALWIFPSARPKLEACGALLEIGVDPETGQDIIVRRELGGASDIVYDEATNPMVRIHASQLVTGP